MKVPVIFVGAATVTLLPEMVVTVWSAPPFILYVNVYGGDAEAPVKVIRGWVAFWQTAIVPLIVPVGSGFTVMVAVPACTCEQLFASVTLSRLYIKEPAVAVDCETVTEFPETVVIDWVAPPFILYEKVKGAVPAAPVKVTKGSAAPTQTAVVPPIEAVGRGWTVTVALPV